MTRRTLQEFRGDLQQHIEMQNVKDNVNMAYGTEPQLCNFVWQSDMIACKTRVCSAMVQS